MSRMRGGRVVGVLLASVAVLLVAGVLSATTVDPGPATTVGADRRVALAGLGEAGLLDEPTTTAPGVTAPPGAPQPTVPATPTTTRPTLPSTTTTTRPAPSAPTTTTTRPTVAPGNIAPASSWQAKDEGVSAKMRIEPANPVAGQPVRFFLEYTGELACCYIFLHFGDEERYALNNTWMCVGESPLSPGAHTATVTHTFAAPGPYLAHLQVLDGDLCTLPPVPPTDGPIPLHNLDVYGCVGVGPGTEAAKGCPPPPNPYPFLPPPPNR